MTDQDEAGRAPRGASGAQLKQEISDKIAAESGLDLGTSVPGTGIVALSGTVSRPCPADMPARPDAVRP